MLTYTIADLDQALKDRDNSLLDSVSFAVRRTSAAKQALAVYYKNLRSSNDTWGRSSTLSGAGIAVGTDKINTTIGHVFRVALDPTQLGIADNTIFVWQSTTTFKDVPRTTIDAILPSGTGATSDGFFENNGEIVIYCKDTDFPNTATMHYSFWRNPTIDTSLPANTIDIRPEDFTSFVDSVYSYMAGS